MSPSRVREDGGAIVFGFVVLVVIILASIAALVNGCKKTPSCKPTVQFMSWLRAPRAECPDVRHVMRTKSQVGGVLVECACSEAKQ